MVRGVRYLKDHSDFKTTFFCLSNANSIFISTILKVSMRDFHIFNQSILTKMNSTKVWKISSKRLSRTQQNGTRQVYSKFGGVSIQKALSIIARLDAVRTCAKVFSHHFHLKLPPNLALLTGEELESFLKRRNQDYDRVVYVGDGSNDYCPILRLRR